MCLYHCVYMRGHMSPWRQKTTTNEQQQINNQIKAKTQNKTEELFFRKKALVHWGFDRIFSHKKINFYIQK